jgi:hypothetical protein
MGVRRDIFRIGETTITVAAAANFIADHVPRLKARKSVYENAFNIINYARNVGHLPRDPAMNAKVFFSWAVDREGWETLKNVPGLEFSVSVSVTGVEGSGSIGVPSGVGIPDDEESLKARVRQLTLENDVLRRELTAAQAELMASKERSAQRSAQAKEHGRRGGRGNAL